MRRTSAMRVVFVLSLFIPWSDGLAADNYVCLGSQATGFQFQAPSNQWRIVAFKPEKFLIRQARKGEGDANTGWVVLKVGEQTPTMFCDRRLAEDRMECEAATVATTGMNIIGQEHFSFRRSTGRFLFASLAGYSEPDAEKTKVTPYISMGECSPL